MRPCPSPPIGQMVGMVTHEQSPLAANTRLRRFLWPLGASTLLGRYRRQCGSPPREIAAGQAPAPTMPGATSNVDQYFIQGLRQALSSDRLDASDRLFSRKAGLQRVIAAQRGAHRRPAPKRPARPRPHAAAAPTGFHPPRGAHPAWLGGHAPYLGSQHHHRWEGLDRDLPTQVNSPRHPRRPRPGPADRHRIPRRNRPARRRAYLAPSRATIEREGDLLRRAVVEGSTLPFKFPGDRAFEPEHPFRLRPCETRSLCNPLDSSAHQPGEEQCPQHIIDQGSIEPHDRNE